MNSEHADATQDFLAEIAGAFDVPGRLQSIAPFGSGHINDTYCCTYAGEHSLNRWVLQRLNHHVFTRPDLVMENIARVTTHLLAKAASAGADVQRSTLRFLRTRDGAWTLRSRDGGWWRMCAFVESTVSYDKPRDDSQVYEAARAFGSFQALLSDLPGPPLHETIPGFHDTPARFRALREAVRRDRCKRVAEAAALISFCVERETGASTLLGMVSRGTAVERVTHNDTKLNNVLFDSSTGHATCVIDLDTVMPGLALYDFGDMVRTGACPVAEDEPDVTLVRIDLGLFEKIAAGYLDAAHDMLSEQESGMLVEAARIITLEQAVRFLTDYLEGDTYYKVGYAGQNLARSAAQAALAKDIEKRAPEMTALAVRRTTVLSSPYGRTE